MGTVPCRQDARMRHRAHVRAYENASLRIDLEAGFARDRRRTHSGGPDAEVKIQTSAVCGHHFLRANLFDRRIVDELHAELVKTTAQRRLDPSVLEVSRSGGADQCDVHAWPRRLSLASGLDGKRS